MRLLPSRAPAYPRSRRRGKTGPLVPALALLVLAGSFYGLWELTAGLEAPAQAPVSRPHAPSTAGARAGEGVLEAPAGAAELRTGQAPLGPDMRRPGDAARAQPGPEALDGPGLRRNLAAVARGFRTATPDLRGLNDLIRALAGRSQVLAPSVEHAAGITRGVVRLEGTDLEAEFEIAGDRHRIRFVESSIDTVHPPFVRLELEIAFATPARQLTDARATLTFVPNAGRNALDHIGAGEELRVGWDVRFAPEGATARGLGARVASDFESWKVGPSDKTRADKRVRDLSSFQAWRTLLAGAQ